MQAVQREIAQQLKVQAPFKDQAALETEVNRRVAFIQDCLRNSGLKTLVLGISGGVDSLVAGRLAQLAVQALRTRTRDGRYRFIAVRLPYGTQVAGLRTRAALLRLRYASALHDESRPIPAWIDAVLERAVHPNPLKRQAELSEFVHELHQPGAATLARTRLPLAERNPLMFWRATALVLAITVIALLGVLHARG